MNWAWYFSHAQIHVEEIESLLKKKKHHTTNIIKEIRMNCENPKDGAVIFIHCRRKKNHY